MGEAVERLVSVVRIESEFPSRPDALHDIRFLVGDRAREAQLNPSAIDEVKLAVSEACANVIRHTNSSSIEVRLRVEQDEVQVEIVDKGIPRGDALEGLFRRTDRGGSYGLILMRALMDEVVVSPGTDERVGTRVRMVKRKR